jgi:hypothetical protein
MSTTMAAAVRFEEPFSATPSLGPKDRARLDELVGHMHRSVVEATLAGDLAAKVELWESYRQARAQAIALLGSASGARRDHGLRSV